MRAGAARSCPIADLVRVARRAARTRWLTLRPSFEMALWSVVKEHVFRAAADGTPLFVIPRELADMLAARLRAEARVTLRWRLMLGIGVERGPTPSSTMEPGFGESSNVEVGAGALFACRTTSICRRPSSTNIFCRSPSEQRPAADGERHLPRHRESPRRSGGPRMALTALIAAALLLARCLGCRGAATTTTTSSSAAARRRRNQEVQSTLQESERPLRPARAPRRRARPRPARRVRDGFRRHADPAARAHVAGRRQPRRRSAGRRDRQHRRRRRHLRLHAEPLVLAAGATPGLNTAVAPTWSCTPPRRARRLVRHRHRRRRRAARARPVRLAPSRRAATTRHARGRRRAAELLPARRGGDGGVVETPRPMSPDLSSVSSASPTSAATGSSTPTSPRRCRCGCGRRSSSRRRRAAPAARSTARCDAPPIRPAPSRSPRSRRWSRPTAASSCGCPALVVGGTQASVLLVGRDAQRRRLLRRRRRAGSTSRSISISRARRSARCGGRRARRYRSALLTAANEEELSYGSVSPVTILYIARRMASWPFSFGNKQVSGSPLLLYQTEAASVLL